MYILGIETSCDETAAAIYETNKGLLSHALYSQITLHAEYGGVVPELASRDHLRKLLPLIQQVIHEARITEKKIDGIAYTAGPGLMGALLVGVGLARSLGWAWRVPTLAIHHLEGHLLAPMLEIPKPDFPFLALLISGGHTALIAVESLGHYHLLGETLDDAVGEAFDKTAKLLGLPYPGGAQLSELARQGDPARFQFPRPMLAKPGLDFSFSGLKTCAVTTWREHGQDAKTGADIARAFEEAVVATLLSKCLRALEQTGLQRLVISGGVSANRRLREAFQQQFSHPDEQRLFFPRLEFCTDNAAMIAYAGHCRMIRGEADDSLSITAKPRWPLAEHLQGAFKC